MNEFGAANPSALWWLAPLLGLLALAVRWERSRIRALKAIGRDEVLNRRRIVLPVLLGVVLAFSAARPYLGYRDAEVPGTGRDIFVVVDISRSMLANDVSPNRLAVAKRKASDIVDFVAQRSPGDRIGIILFAGESYLFCPLTADYGVVRVFVSAITTDLISTGGSTLGKALEMVIGSIEETEAAAPLTIVVSDGEDANLQSRTIAEALKRRDVKVNVIGVGSVEGRPIPVQNGAFLKDDNGSIVVSKLNESALTEIATITGGSYRRATIDDEDIIGALQGSPGDRRAATAETVRSYNDVGSFGALAVLVVLLGAAIFRRTWIWRALVCILLPLTLPRAAAAESGAAPTLFDGAQRYARGDYAGAAETFESHSKREGARWDLSQALGAAAYKQRDYKRALSAYDDALGVARNGRERFETLYSRGNAKVLGGDFKGAIADYNEALAVKPGDEPTLANKAVAERLLEEKPPPPPEENNGGGDTSPSDSKSAKGEESGERPQDQPSQGSDESSKSKGESSEDPLSAGAPTPTQDGSDAQHGDGAEEEQNTPVPSPAPSPREGTPGSGPATPSAQTPTPSPEGAGSSKDAGGGEDEPAAAQAMKEAEAKSWLQSLEESPVLLERRGSRRRTRGAQTW